MDFSNLWKHCYRYTHAFFHSIKLSVAHRYQQCHCLAAFPAKMSVFNSHMQNVHSVISNKPRLHTKNNIHACNKNPESLYYEQEYMSFLIWTEMIIEYWFNYTEVPLPNFLLQCEHQHLDDIFVAHNVFRNAGNNLRWWYLSLIVGVHLLLN